MFYGFRPFVLLVKQHVDEEIMEHRRNGHTKSNLKQIYKDLARTAQ